MADEILVSGIGDLIAGEVLATEYLMLLADRDASVLNHPAWFKATGTSRNNVVRVPHLGLMGYDLLSATTPGSEVANTALTDGSTDVTIAPRAKRYEMSDFARYVAAGKLGPAMLAQDLVVTVQQTLISLLANVCDDFSATASPGSGINLDWDTIVSAKGTISVANNQGPLLCLLHPQQWNDLEAEALGLGILPTQTMAGVITRGMESYKGNYFGIDFFTSSRVPTANASADRAGCLIAPGAVAWADATMDPENDPNVADFGTARLERVRRGTFLQTAWVFSHYSGVSKAIEAAGVTIISDA